MFQIVNFDYNRSLQETGRNETLPSWQLHVQCDINSCRSAVFIVNFEHIPQNFKHTFVQRELFVYVGKTMFQLVTTVAKMDAFLVHYYQILSDTVRFHSAMWSEPCLR